MEEQSSVWCPRCAGRLDVFEEAQPTVLPTAEDPSDAPTRLPEPAGVSAEGLRPAAGPSAAAAAAPPAPGETPAGGSGPRDMAHLLGRVVDGYRIEKLLGAGGMGAVFLAHQLSLDRKVALKLLPARWAASAELMARFTREALSAAQLNHHNVVQVYDVGNQGDLYYIAMEYVPGETLGDMIRRHGRLRLDDAAGFALQAARGLKYAHERGIIHRDIKPANLLVNDQGVVKIADMGLAKRLRDVETDGREALDRESLLRESSPELTAHRVAMGTPAYMAPEQARDARSVDTRADQYSLGCTLYYLCAGAAPYQGTTAFELISKHLNEPLTPLTVHVRGVPPTFSRIIERMLAKQPEERYPDMEAVIGDLEAYLGVGGEKGPYRPRDQHVAILEAEAARYQAAPSLRRRRLALTGFFAMMGGLTVVAVLLRNLGLLGGTIGLAALAPAAHFVIDGVRGKGYFFRRVRSLFFGMPLKSWAVVLGGTVLGAGALYVLGWWIPWILVGAVGVGLAVAYERLVLKPLRAERAEPIATTQALLKELRLRGVAEEALQDFACRFSGEVWEAFFEELFGYEAMILARGKWAAADKIKPRRKHAVLRDPIARWLDAVEEARRTARERRQLARVEARRLKAAGVSAAEASRQAAEAATRILAADPRKQARDVQRRALAEQARLARPSRRRWAFAFRLARAVAGLAMLGAWSASLAATQDVQLPTLGGLLTAEGYFGWGWGGTMLGLVAGIGLVISAFSSRTLGPALVVVGAALAAFSRVIVEWADRPQLNPATALLGSVGLLALGLALSVLGKLAGQRF